MKAMHAHVLLAQLALALLPLAIATTTADSAAARSAGAGAGAAWPRTVQPFFLSALNTALTAENASYLGGLPVVVINHKQAGGEGKSEQKQLAALSLVKAANASCATFFYLNSQIDFPTLALHDKFVANGTWWLRDRVGNFVVHGSDKIFDFTMEAARSSWLATAVNALSQPYISGVFVDKASGFDWKGAAPARVAAWNSGHQQLLQSLGAAAAAAKKRVIFNNVGVVGVAGQLFERWGEVSDHDGLGVQQDMELLGNLTGAGNTGQLSLARAGGYTPGSTAVSPPDVCGAALAEMLLSVASPNTAFFACMPSFNVIDGWMTFDRNPIYQQYLGAPKGEAVVGKGGLVTRVFEGAIVTLNTSAFAPQTAADRLFDRPSPPHLNRGCVRWSSGTTAGVCP